MKYLVAIASLFAAVQGRCPSLLTPGEHLKTVTVGGIEREFYVHVPDGQSENPHPLSIMYHGCGSSPEKFEMESQMNGHTNAHHYYNIYPRGTLSSTRLGWNAGFASCGANVNDVDFTRAVLLFALEELCVDETRIFGGGFSNGGSMIFNVSCELPTYFRGFGFVGMLPPSVAYPHACSVDAKPIFGFCGSQDSICATGMEGWFSKYAIEANCNDAAKIVQESSTTTCFSHEDCRTGPVRFCGITGLGHCWPGNDCCDTQCRDQNPANIDTSNALLRFWDSLAPEASTLSKEAMITSLKAELKHQFNGTSN
eukprot:TRINITY_DN12771_c0_g1_i1.p1 TRINITY_DN12771_c0_g1~~TRINITY_DN12771_c0_g1_i1.p1  ORF type:complete len:333 (+),score=55.81 TRINITY_DN12771_c0_g1_i1:69-1001(+)